MSKMIEKVKRSESIMNLAAALAVAQGQINPASKDAKGNYSKYSTLDAIWDACRQALSENGLSVVQIPSTSENELSLETILFHSSGEWISGTISLPIVSGRMNEHQALGSALTYARRYSLAAMVGIASGDDDDGEASRKLTTSQAEYKQDKKPKPVTASQAEDKEPKPVTPNMNVAKLLKRLNQENEINGFYKKTSDIKSILTAGRSWPEPDDIAAWKLLFEDALEYAIGEIKRAIEEGDLSPDQAPALDYAAGEIKRAIEESVLSPDQAPMPQEMAVESAMDDDIEGKYPEIFQPEAPH